MGRYTGSESARPGRSSSWPVPGRYLIRIDKCVEGVTPSRKEFSAAESTCLHDFGDTPSADVHPLELLPTPARLRPGQSFTDMMMAQSTGFLPSIVGLIKGAMNLGKDDQVPESDCDRVFSDEQPLAGKIVEIEVWDVIKKGPRDRGVTAATAVADDLFTKIVYNRAYDEAEARAVLAPEIAQRHLGAV